MSLRTKAVGVIAVTLLIIIVLVYTFSNLFLLKPFVNLENEKAVQSMHGITMALQDRLTFLDKIVTDWAHWDDTYTFVQTGDDRYVRANLVDDTFTNLGINIIVFANKSGDIVFGKAFDSSKRIQTQIPPDLVEHLAPSSLLLHHTSLESSTKGILVLTENVMLIASRPVLTSKKEGPIQRTLIMGYFIDQGFWKGLSRAEQIELTVTRFDEINKAPELVEAVSYLSEHNSTFVKESGNQILSTYTLLYDIYGKPALILKTDRPREIYARAKVIVSSFLLYILAAGFSSAVVAMFFLDRTILARLARFSQTVARISKSGNLSDRLSDSGNDEIDELARSINAMLTKIENGQTALAESEEKYRTILEEMQEGYLELDLAGNTIFSNDAMCQMLGYSRDGLLGTHWHLFIHPDDVEAVSQTISQVYNTDKPSGAFTWRFLRRDGNVGYTETYVYPKHDKSGNIVGLRILTRDVSERKLLEQQVLTANKLASVGEMAAGIAHELNNPLTGVIGYAQLLMMRNDLPLEVKNDLSKICEAGQRAARIVKGLLTFARPDQTEKKFIDINELIERTVELCNYEFRTTNIEVQTKLSPELPRVLADYTQIQQVVLNILVNAGQAISELKRPGKITITTEAKEGYVTIAISDNGPGIPANIQDKVFDPFFTTKEVGKGTGLGLSISHGIVTAHGGKIYFRSQDGKGTTFFVKLPRANGPAIVDKKQLMS